MNPNDQTPIDSTNTNVNSNIVPTPGNSLPPQTVQPTVSAVNQPVTTVTPSVTSPQPVLPNEAPLTPDRGVGQPTVDTSHLFMPDNPYASEQNTLSQPMEVLADAPGIGSKKMFMLIPVVVIIVALVGGGGYFLVQRQRAKQLSSAESAPTSTISDALGDTNIDAFATDTPPDTSKTEEKKTASKTPSSTKKSSGSTGGSTSTTTPTRSTTTTKKKTSTSITIPKTTTPTITKPSVTYPTSVNCTVGSLYGKPLSASIIQQVEGSITAALKGEAEKLTSWLSASEKVIAGTANPSTVNTSFKNLGPKNCTLLPTIFVDASSYRTQGMTLLVEFKDTARGKAYLTTVSVALVQSGGSSIWRTENITPARARP